MPKGFGKKIEDYIIKCKSDDKNEEPKVIAQKNDEQNIDLDDKNEALNINEELAIKKDDIESKNGDSDDTFDNLNINEVLSIKKDDLFDGAVDLSSALTNLRSALKSINTFMAMMFTHYTMNGDKKYGDKKWGDRMAEFASFCSYLEDKAAGKSAAEAYEKTGNINKDRESFDYVISCIADIQENNETGLDKMMDALWRQEVDNVPDDPMRAIKKRLVRLREIKEKDEYVSDAGNFVAGLELLADVTKTNMRPEIEALKNTVKAQRKEMVDAQFDCIRASITDIYYSRRWRANSTEYGRMRSSAMRMGTAMGNFCRCYYAGKKEYGKKKQKLINSMKTAKARSNEYVQQKTGGDENYTPWTAEGKKRLELAKSIVDMTGYLIKREEELDPLPEPKLLKIAKVISVGKPFKASVSKPFKAKVKTLAEQAQDIDTEKKYNTYKNKAAPAPEPSTAKKDIVAKIIAANIVDDWDDDDMRTIPKYFNEAINYVADYVESCDTFSKLMNDELMDDKNDSCTVEEVIWLASEGERIPESLLLQIKQEMSNLPDLQETSLLKKTSEGIGLAQTQSAQKKL